MLLRTHHILDEKGSKATCARACHAPSRRTGAIRLLHRIMYASALCLLAGCIDTSYDPTDPDLTMGLGANGLKVKLGNTEKIYLKDIIDTDGNTKIDASNRFYLTEHGSTELNYTVQDLTSSVDRLARITCTQHVVGWDTEFWNQMGVPAADEITIPAGTSLHGTAYGENQADFTAHDIGSEVKRITRVYPKDFGASLTVSVKSSNAVDFTLDRLQDFSVTLPKYVHLREVPRGWTLNGRILTYNGNMQVGADKKEVCAINIDYIDLEEEGIPTNGEVHLNKEITRVAMQGTAYFSAKSSFVMREGDYADIMLDIQFRNDGYITIDSIRGIFDPEITPDVEPINISDNLPEFLKDETTKIKVSNPTLRFSIDTRSLPVGANLSASLTSVKNGKSGWSERVDLPQVTIQHGRNNMVYYHQSGNKPYDPDSEVAATAIVQRVSNLGNLIERLPDRIEVNMKDGRVSLLQQEATMSMGRTYRATADYSVYVPLEVEQGFRIVYRDSTESVSDDLEDYSAHGLRINCTAENTIPLALTLQVVACDSYGKPVPGVTFSTVNAKAGQGEGKSPVKSDLQVDGDLQNPYDLRLIDHFLFVVTAQSNENVQAQPLTAQQYVRLADIKLRLKGAVTVNLN